ncbi:DUF5827 family protein [Haloferax volcanii]|uniref:Uncharacterized protein n=3 Tax=Haloferax volcanii TaxID=2246 RepID=A0A384LI27_HALVD|nr:DUF5827 family protein [Haloferax volcanii]ADE04617.1 uncharacterized protein HVO_2915 [Haloferax volcanii DS2]ELY24526.1 hypothetical protein C498_17765 [Haloferax volcanii DS2]MBS8121145.1 hypothetical protein [Haloferax volcanii]MBS8126156.1 hypothetical protein [Haloferax volcanii]MBS8130010.1 hypothetical protein [Haloferax volcanii]
MPRPKDDFDTLYGYLLYEPADILDPDYMYTVGEIARLMQGLSPQDDLAEETEDRIIQWTIPWIVANQEDFVINDPRSDEPGYFGLHPDAVPEADEE